jgi:hypothetical protein
LAHSCWGFVIATKATVNVVYSAFGSLDNNFPTVSFRDENLPICIVLSLQNSFGLKLEKLWAEVIAPREQAVPFQELA